MPQPNPDPHAARAYARIKYRLFLLEVVLSFIFLVGLYLSGLSHQLVAYLDRTGVGFEVGLALYLAAVGLLAYLLQWPLHFYRSFRLEHRFGLSRLSLRAWWVREAKRVGLSALLSLILLEGFYAILRFGGACWPLWATAGWAAVSVVLARLLPTVLIPIFYPLQPIHDAGLTQRLLHLAEAVRVPVLGVFRVGLGIETKKANAALVGLGRTRRILLSDTLLARFSHDEIEGVLAHELAHHCYRHMAKGLALSVVSTLVALWLTAALAPYALTALGLPHLSALAGFPLLMVWFVLLQLLGMPIRNGISRLFEWQADRFALARTSPAVFAAALERLAQQNLADPCPPRWVEIWLHDHPAMHKRIAAARAYSDLKGQ